MPEILAIAQTGNPILRQSASAIDQLHNPEVQKLIDNLIATVRQANGVGIAAPQVSQSCRIFIVASRPNTRYPNAPEMAPTAMINPRIITYSGTVEKGWEGCLSVPNMRGLVPRHTAITVEYCDRNGQLYQQELTDFIARIFQHELDHLDGILFPDRVESPDDLVSEIEYLRIMAQSASKAS